MDRRQYIKATGAAVTGSALAGCAASGAENAAGEGDANDDGEGSGSGGPGTGTLATSVTDQPVDIDDFESCVVTIDGIWVNPASGEADEATDSDGDDRGEASTDAQGTEENDAETGSGTEGDSDDLEDEKDVEGDGPNEGAEDAAAAEGEGRRYIEFDEPQEADLVRLQGANTQLIDETELVVGEYRYLQLDVAGVEGVLIGGGEAEIDTPGNAPLKFNEPFEIRAGERTRFVADFAPVRRGQGDRYLLRPVARGTRVLYGDEEYDPEDSSEEGDGTGEDGDGDEEAVETGADGENGPAGKGGSDDAGED